MLRKLIHLFCFNLLFVAAYSQAFDKAKLDQYFHALEENNKFMGSISITQNENEIYSTVAGFADEEQKLKLNHDSKFRIGSISKTFTATLVFKAIEEGKMNLTDFIVKYFPSIKNADKITISNLLNHRSGIHNFTDDKDYITWSNSPKTEKEMVDIITNAGNDFEPNAKAAYSNSNFVLLSYILEKVYRKTYKDILGQKIIKPLGLQNTHFGGKIDVNKNECNSYSFKGGWYKETETNMTIPMGAGGIVSTPYELNKFMEGLFAGKLISTASLDQMKTIKDNYGMGLFKIPFYDKRGFGHTGGIDGFSSTVSYFPEEKLSFALTSNGSNYTNNDIAIAALSCYFNKPFSIPDFKTVDLKSEDLDKYLGGYSSKEMPLKIMITKNDNQLIAQATGQSSFALDATAKDKFEFKPAGIVLEFLPENKQMIMQQGGRKFVFSKD